jgi:hypothetical protein
MNRNPRNQSLLAQLSATNPFRETLAPRVFAIGNDFEKAVEAVGQDGRLSQQGKKEKARSHLEKALRELDDAQKPIADYRNQTASLRSEMKAPTYDKSDIVGAMNRHKMLDRSVAMTAGQRAGLMTGKTRSVAFVDAIFEFADDPWMAGINIHDPGEREIFEAAREERLRDLNGPLMDALEARASVESEIAMVIDIVRNDLESDATDLASRAA